MRHAVLLLASACAPTGALAIGPTIDSDRVVRLEGDAELGAVLGGNDVRDVADPTQRSIGVWAVGLRLALGAGSRLADSQGWLGGYIEYLQLGTPGAPWGFHVGLTFAATFASHAQPVIGFDAGFDHLAHAHSEDTGDGFATTFVTNGLDLIVRGHGDSWWQLGAFYVRRGTMLYE
jgi:hypothetical protein